MKRKPIALLGVLMVLAGVATLAYPLISNTLYQNRQKELVEYYDTLVAELPEEEKSTQWQDCWDYNAGLIQGGVRLTDPFEEMNQDPNQHPYVDLLNISSDGAMGSLQIPAINVDLVIYHGTEEDVLQKGVGHLHGTSLPVGGTGSHAVLSAHTGLMDKELFTNLDQLQLGDVFYLHILHETLAYQVDQILTVLPDETEALRIDSAQDYVTLVTCTPYGVNSHRLLVRGTRIPYEEAQVVEQATPQRGSTWRQEYFAALVAGLIVVAVVIMLVFLFFAVRMLYSARRNR